MTTPRWAALSDLQPSQLYVSSAKLAAVRDVWSGDDATTPEPLPVKRYGDRLVLTDGHTRALAAHLTGLDTVPVVYDEDDLDDEAYEICVGWCDDAGIHSAADLEGRVVTPDSYARLWLDRCREMQRDLQRRRSTG